MIELTWEEKLSALMALTETCVKMRAPGNWYVAAYDRGVSDGSICHSLHGNGVTPQSAVEDDWRKMLAVQEPKMIVVQHKQLSVRWNGFMWENIPQ